jgi:mono/diheme cytochrome c family protein
MGRWGKFFVFAVAVAVAGRAYGRLPAPQAIRLDKPSVPGTATARGRVVYERYGCRMCHGDAGEGGFANPNAETDGKVPAIKFVKEGYTPAEIAKLIRTGTPRIGLADPKGQTPPYRMPSWDDRMSAREVDDLVQYLLSLYPASAQKKWR